MKPNIHSLTLLLVLLLAPIAVSAQTKTCPKCKRAIQVSQYAAHQGNCKGVPKPTTQRCPQCGKQVAVAQYSSHVASHKPVTRQCPQCGKQVPVAQYSSHVASHNKPDPLPTKPTDLGYNTPQTKTFTVNGVSFTMVGVQGGRFTMGALPNDKDADSDEKPRHQVTLSSFYIGRYEVTQELWQAVMGSNPSRFKGDLQRPVERVSWNDCQTFIRKLNELTGENFRLPTEAEWEYAARGGQKSSGYLYSGSNDIGSVAWYDDNSYNKGSSHPDYGTHPVGRKQPNELGLYDMTGNVWEWCQDWYGSYGSSAQTNPTGPASASYRVNRGGCWSYGAGRCRASNRDGSSPDDSGHDLGLRLAR